MSSQKERSHSQQLFFSLSKIKRAQQLQAAKDTAKKDQAQSRIVRAQEQAVLKARKSYRHSRGVMINY